MRPAAVLDEVVEDHFSPVEEIEMTIDPEDFGHLMAVLTNLYGDAEMAVLREYSTNAWDGHIMAGNTSTPIEVTLPNYMSQVLRIKDHGVGMDLATIRTIYSRYGKSTKRGDVRQNGQLGLGSKSGLAYSNQFTVISVKDGVEHTVSVSLDERRMGRMDVISSVPTTESNGITIEIPAKRGHNFASKAAHLFRFWDSGTVLVDGKPNVSIRDKALEVSPGLFQVDGLNRDYIVLAQVPYPVEAEHQFWTQQQYQRQFGVVYFAEPDPIKGAPVEHTPSREALYYTPVTMATIEKARDSFVKHFTTALQAKVDAKLTAWEAWGLAYQLNRSYSGVTFDFNYKGVKVPVSLKCPIIKRNKMGTDGKPLMELKDPTDPKSGRVPVTETICLPWISYFVGQRKARYSSHSQNQYAVIDPSQQSFTLVTGYPYRTEPSTTVKAKLRKHLEEIGRDGESRFLFVDKAPDDFWTASWKRIDYEDVRNTKLASQKKAKTSKFLVLQANGSWVEEMLDPTKQKFAYVSPPDANVNSSYPGQMSKGWAQKHKVLSALGWTTILLNANRHDKFARENAGSRGVFSLMREIRDNYDKSLSEDDKWILGTCQDTPTVAFLREIIDGKFDVADPDVVASVERFKRLEPTHKDLMDKREAMHKAVGVSALPTPASPFASYPLMGYVISNSYGRTPYVRDLLVYMNAIYNDRKATKP